MPRSTDARTRALIVVTAAAFFGLGLAASGLIAGRRDAPIPPLRSTAAEAGAAGAVGEEQGGAPDAGDAGGPRVLFDPSSITLLPDASLRLDLPEGFDASSPP